jgi:nucleotide-binding universal stress UspA family protein
MADENLILIAIDGSEQSEQAFEFYATHLHRPTNKLLIVHGAELPQMSVNEAAIMCQTIWDQLMDGEKKKVKLLEEKYAAMMRSHGMTGKIEAIFCGRPGELIVELAEKEKCAMVVMGTRGFGVVRRTIMGSVSDYVLHHAHCPVVICRRHSEHPKSTSSS